MKYHTRLLQEKGSYAITKKWFLNRYKDEYAKELEALEIEKEIEQLEDELEEEKELELVA